MSAKAIFWLSQHTVPQWVWALAHMAFQQPPENRRQAFEQALEPLLATHPELQVLDFSWIDFEENCDASPHHKRRRRQAVIEDEEDDEETVLARDLETMNDPFPESSPTKEMCKESSRESTPECLSSADEEEEEELYYSGNTMLKGGFYKSVENGETFYYRVDVPADRPTITWLYTPKDTEELYRKNKQALPRRFHEKYTDCHLLLSTHKQKQFEVPLETCAMDANIIMDATQPLKFGQFYVTAILDIQPDHIIVQPISCEADDYTKRLHCIADALIARGTHGNAHTVKAFLLEDGPQDFLCGFDTQKKAELHTCFACNSTKLVKLHTKYKGKTIWLGAQCAKYLNLAHRMYFYRERGENPQTLQLEWTQLLK